MKYIITESQNNNLKVLLTQIIKSKGVGTATKSVNGLSNFMKIMDINTPIEFLYLFNDLEVVQSNEERDTTLFRRKPGKNIMVQENNFKISQIYVSYDEIFSILTDFFKMENSSARENIYQWLRYNYDLDMVSPDHVRIMYPFDDEKADMV